MFELLRHRLRHNRRFRALWIPAAGLGLGAITLGAIVWTLISQLGGPAEIASRLAARGQYEAAETHYWKALENRVETKTLIAFIENHADLLEYAQVASLIGEVPPRPIPESRVIRLLQRNVPEPARTLAWYWYQARISTDEPDRARVLRLADRPSPVRWANHLLGREAMLTEEYAKAAGRFEREGLAFPEEATGDLELALRLWAEEQRWDEVQRRLQDPRYREVAGASIRLGLALEQRRWVSILALLWPASFEDVRVWPVLLAVLAASLWLWIAARLGRAGERVHGRIVLYALAFLLGILSIYPTLVVITLEETFLGLREVGAPVADAIYYVFGVGLREEACKILMFLPLLPVLEKRGSRLEALTCGALVGLGFAAEENINYFHQMSLSSAVVRFLTANFLHMALTGLVGVSLYDGLRRREPVDRFSVVFPLAVLFHGAYDFFLTSADFGDLSLVSMLLFILLAQRYLRQVTPLLPTTEQDDVLRLFVLSLIGLSAVSYVYASGWVGPFLALFVVAEGLVGVAIIIFMFVRELG